MTLLLINSLELFNLGDNVHPMCPTTSNKLIPHLIPQDQEMYQ